MISQLVTIVLAPLLFWAFLFEKTNHFFIYHTSAVTILIYAAVIYPATISAVAAIMEILFNAIKRQQTRRFHITS